MKAPVQRKPSFSDLHRISSPGISQSNLVKSSQLRPGQSLPLLLEPVTDGVDLISWGRTNRDFIQTNLLKHGAILFRNFGVTSAVEFEQLIAALSGEAIEYRERSSPRRTVSGYIYTSTEYPADQRIFPHNENSYAHVWPMKIFFYCALPAEAGGETPIADVRRVYARISSKIKERFARKKVLYVRNHNVQLGLTWQMVFQTNDRAAVESYCADAGYEFEWGAGERLRTRWIGQAIAVHPQTGEAIWFNHAAFFHVSTLDPASQALLSEFAEEDLPNQTFYGDGSQIEPEVLDEVRDAYQRELVSFTWQRGDVLLLDNMLTAHAREPFVGQRQILVGMSEPVYNRNAS